MGDKTATQVATEMRQRDMDERRTKMMIEEFTHRWGPDDKGEMARFTGDLHYLMQQVSIQVNRPFIDAAAEAMARQPLSPVVLKR